MGLLDSLRYLGYSDDQIAAIASGSNDAMSDASNQKMISGMLAPQGTTGLDYPQSSGTGAPMGYGAAAVPQSAPTPAPNKGTPVWRTNTATPAPGGLLGGNQTAQPQQAGLLGALTSASPDSAAAGVAALPNAGNNADFVPPTSGDDSSVLGQDTQSAQGGLLGSFGQTTQALQQAAQSPDTSGDLLGALGNKLKQAGDRLTNLSPEASQGLLVSGLQMLRANDGTRNLGQVAAEGGIAGLQTYDALNQQKAANGLAQQKAALDQQRWQTETNLKVQQQSFDQQYRVQQAQFEGYKYAHPNLVPQQTVDGQGNAVTVFVDPQSGRVAPNSPALPIAPKYATVDTGGNVAVYNENRPQAGPVANFAKSMTPQQTIQQNQPTDEQIKGYDANDTTIRTQRANADKASATADALMRNPSDNGAIASRWNSFIGDPSATQIQYDQTIQAATKANLAGLGSGSGISDKDMLFAAKGMPGQNASASEKAQFLRGYAKIQTALADQSQDYNDFARANGRFGQGPAQQPLTVNGISVPAGTNADQFAAKSSALRAANQAAMQSDAQLKQQAGGDGEAFHTLEIKRAQARQFIEAMRKQGWIK